MKFSELKAWAESLGYGFTETELFDKPVMLANHGKCTITLELSYYAESLGGGQHITFTGEDNRKSYSGVVCSFDTTDEAAQLVDRYAATYGIPKVNSQLSMF